MISNERRPTNRRKIANPGRLRPGTMYTSSLKFLKHTSLISIPKPISSYHPSMALQISSSMEDNLSALWESLSLTESESTTLVIDQSKLSTPTNALVGRLAITKFVSLFEMEKGMKIIWELTSAMETTRLGNNLFLFTFQDSKTRDRVFENQLWNYRGSHLLMNRILGDECPADFTLHSAPFWVQAHGLQLRAMNKVIGVEIGQILGHVLEVRSDAEGGSLGRCIRI